MMPYQLRMGPLCIAENPVLISGLSDASVIKLNEKRGFDPHAVNEISMGFPDDD